MTPVTQTLTEVIADRVVTIAQLVAFCYCWRHLLLWSQRRAELKDAKPVDLPGAPGSAAA